MDKKNTKISVKALAEEITRNIKEDLVARYTKEERGIQIHFLNGQNFRVFVEEI